VISKKKNGKEEKNIHMFTNNSMICQMEDRGSHHEPAYHDHKEVVKWHSHYGHHTRDMIQWIHQKNKVLGIGGLIMSRPTHPSLLPSEWHCDPSGHQASTMASILILKGIFLVIRKGSWFQRVKK